MRRAADDDRIAASGCCAGQSFWIISVSQQMALVSRKSSATWQLHFRQRMEALVRAEHERLKAELPKQVRRPRQTVVTGYLIFEEAVHEKPKGRKMGGLGGHYFNTGRKWSALTAYLRVCIGFWVNVVR
jgi:hypothetical protein